MFHKVRFRLTLLCTAVTGAILIALSLICLHLSKQSMSENNFLSFQKDISTILNNLEQQSVLSFRWLSQMETDGRYYLFLEDNGIPLKFGTYHSDQMRAELNSELKEYSASIYPEQNISSLTTQHMEYPFQSNNGDRYYASTAYIPKSSGQLTAYFLFPLKNFEAQFQQQQLLFLFSDLFALFLLFLFFRHVTKKLLLPAEESQQEQIRFIASASHELRTPLAVMLSAVSVLSLADQSEKPSIVHTIQEEGMQMSRLIDDMLMLSHSKSRSFSIHKAPEELDTLLLEVYENMEPLALKKGITLSISLPDAILPPCSCDKQRIAQVFSILISNAVSHAEGTKTVELVLSRIQNEAVISIIDHGPGIPNSEKKQIFDRFYHGGDEGSKKGHFGLGLCIAQELILAHHGKLEVKDTNGGGATFLVHLKL